jgi:hypothetical protein
MQIQIQIKTTKHKEIIHKTIFNQIILYAINVTDRVIQEDTADQ